MVEEKRRGRRMKSGARGQPKQFAPSGALMTRLLLIRHGQTKLHRADRFWGKTDIELSDTGIRQAEQLRDRLARYKINAIYASTLRRAIDTAEIIASRHKVQVTQVAELCECNFGYVEGLTFREIAQKYPELARELTVWKAVAFPGGESLEQLNRRVQSFLDKLKQHQPESTIVIVSHGGPLRLIICHLLGIGVEHWLQIRVDHASLSIVETYPQGAIVNLLNDISHLKS
jgi:alpha-ribazole phosphatase